MTSTVLEVLAVTSKEISWLGLVVVSVSEALIYNVPRGAT
jgi:hypothetical protein